MEELLRAQAYSDRRDCCRPVPQITTSQVVSLIDSMAAAASRREREGCVGGVFFVQVEVGLLFELE